MNIFLSYSITNINNKFRKKWFKISRGWKYFEAESFLRLKVSRGRNCLRAESVSQLFSGPQVSQGWKCLLAESFSEPQVSQGWNCRNWKCLRAESVFHPHGWKCLAAENVWAANFSQWKLSQGWKCLRDEVTPIWQQIEKPLCNRPYVFQNTRLIELYIIWTKYILIIYLGNWSFDW